MSIASQISKTTDVKQVSAMMGTENNKEVLRNTKMLDAIGEKAEPNDLIIAILSDNQQTIEKSYKLFLELLDAKKQSAQKSEDDCGCARNIVSIKDAFSAFDANLALFSIPGPFVYREALLALKANKNVMIFSDNVTIEEEKKLKQFAAKKGLIVMGPDCGTAIINGIGLAFANAMPKGNIAIIGASGTGIQQVSVILANNDFGVKHAIGLGGRDLSKDIGGISMLTALDMIEKDKDIELVILISKPPAAEVEKKILERLKKYSKKVVVNFLKGNEAECKKYKLPFAATLETAAKLAISILTKNNKILDSEFDLPTNKINALIADCKKKFKKNTFIRGLYSGGTLCDEALFLFDKNGIKVYSNIPLKPELKLKDANISFENTLVDLGDDEFTKGRPHPMIDYTLRCERLVKEASDKDTGIILLDIVTGFGSHPTPQQPLAEAIKKAKTKNKNLIFIASICGTKFDKQNISEITETLEKLGVIIMPTNAQAVKLITKIIK